MFGVFDHWLKTVVCTFFHSNAPNMRIIFFFFCLVEIVCLNNRSLQLNGEGIFFLSHLKN